MKRLLATLLLLATPAFAQEEKPKITVPTSYTCISPTTIVLGVTEAQSKGMPIELVVLKGKEAQTYLDVINAGLGTAWKGDGVLIVVGPKEAAVFLAQGPFVCNIQSLPLAIHAKTLTEALGRPV